VQAARSLPPGAPLCHLAEAPEPDLHLEVACADLAQALVATGYGVPADVARLWVTLRETHSAKTTVALLPPTGADWTPARLEHVRHKMTGGGYVSVVGIGTEGGFRSPCPGVEGRVTGIGRDVPALPSAARR
jgi:hypothetical protein